MTLLNAILALGALSFTVPLLIHLLHRTKYRTVDWGAMHLLQSTIRVNSKRLQWQQLLLLLLRCLLPILLAFAMARPMVQSWLSSGVGEPIALAIVLDDSLSMQSVDGSGTSRWTKGLTAIDSILTGVPQGSSVAFVLGGESVRLQNTSSVGEARKQIDQWKGSKSFAGPFALQEATQLGLKWLQSSSPVRRQLLFVSDFQSNDWGNSGGANALVATMLDQQSIRPEVACYSVMDLTTPKLETDNVSVESIEVAPRILTKSLDAVLTATLHNFGNTPRDNVRVRFRIDGTEIYQQAVTIPARSTLQLRTMWSPTVAKHSLAQVSLSLNDELTADNELTKVLPVVEPISVLLIDGDRRGEPMQSETDFLKLALSPFSVVGQTKGDPFRCKMTPLAEWNEGMLKDVSVVALCNIPELSPQQQTWLKSFVESGKGLMVFPGNRMNWESWQRMPTLANGGIRPADFSAPKKIDSTQTSASAVAIETETMAFEPLAEMPKPSLAALSAIEILAYTPMSATEDGKTTVVAKLNNGDPWIVRSELGKGVALWFSMACDDDDCNLPSKPVFLPLMQRLAMHVSNPISATTSIAPGQPWLLVPPAIYSAEVGSAQLRVYDPLNREHTAEGMRMEETRLAGVYEAKWTSPQNNQSTYVVVNPRQSSAGSSDDSSLSPADKEALERELASWKVKWFDSTQTFVDSMKQEWIGREIWSWLWIGAILCFLGEMLIEQRFLPQASRGSTIATRSNRGGQI